MAGNLFPAWAGVILMIREVIRWIISFPRMGGGDPAQAITIQKG